MSQYKQDGNFSQLSQRNLGVIYRDQHGRRYSVMTEKRTGHPCGLIEPLFQAPLMPHQKYLMVGVDPERPNYCPVNYALWEKDIRDQRAEWEDRGRKLQRHMKQAAYRADEPLTREVVDMLGDPGEAVEPVIAARQGNPWVLGFTDTVDVRLAKFLNLNKTEEQRRAAEPDFSTVVTELEADFEAIEDDTDAERRRTREREKKRRQREAKRQAVPVEG